LCAQCLKINLGDLGFTLATKQRHLPVVLDDKEVSVILSHMTGYAKTVVALLFGSGLRVNECLRLRVQDINFNNFSIIVRDGCYKKLYFKSHICSANHDENKVKEVFFHDLLGATR